MKYRRFACSYLLKTTLALYSKLIIQYLDEKMDLITIFSCSVHIYQSQKNVIMFLLAINTPLSLSKILNRNEVI